MKKFDAIQSYFDKVASFFKLSNFLHFVSLEGFCLCSDSAYAGKSTCTTAFVETMILCIHNILLIVVFFVDHYCAGISNKHCLLSFFH